MTWMLYGANGYTGRLIAQEAVERGMRPILAGRSEEPIRALAAELDLPARVFRVDSSEDASSQLNDVELVLNCAGPFSVTAASLRRQCLATQTDYLDITGEIDVLEETAALHDEAAAANVVLLPSVGFDVVPSDCLAAMLAERLPGAVRLQLAFGGLTRLSPGTTKTMLENIPRGGRARIDGKIERVPVAWKTRQIPFADGLQWAMTIPWGDVSSAYYSTGVSNIEVYTALPRSVIWWARRLRWISPALGARAVQASARRLVEWRVKGPTAERRRQSQAQLWGRVENERGESVEATMTTPDGYALTALTSLWIIQQWPGARPAPGFTTPSKAFGADMILQIPGVVCSLNREEGDEPRRTT